MKTKIIIIGLVLAAVAGSLILHKSPAPMATDSHPTLAATNLVTPTVTAPTVAPAVQPAPAVVTTALPGESGDDLRKKIEAAMASNDPNARALIYSLLAKWVHLDPAAAAQFAGSLPVGSWRTDLLRSVAQDWATQDATSAEAWAAQLSDTDERNAALSSVYFQVAQKNARQAVEMAEKNGLGAVSGPVMENLIQQWAGQDIAGATTWVKALPPGDQRDGMMGRLAFIQSTTDPAGAASMVVQQIPPGPTQTEAAISVLHQWAIQDMAGATAWVNLFPAGDLRDRAERELQGIATYTHAMQTPAPAKTE